MNLPSLHRLSLRAASTGRIDEPPIGDDFDALEVVLRRELQKPVDQRAEKNPDDTIYIRLLASVPVWRAYAALVAASKAVPGDDTLGYDARVAAQDAAIATAQAQFDAAVSAADGNGATPEDVQEFLVDLLTWHGALFEQELPVQRLFETSSTWFEAAKNGGFPPPVRVWPQGPGLPALPPRPRPYTHPNVRDAWNYWWRNRGVELLQDFAVAYPEGWLVEPERRHEVLYELMRNEIREVGVRSFQDVSRLVAEMGQALDHWLEYRPSASNPMHLQLFLNRAYESLHAAITDGLRYGVDFRVAVNFARARDPAWRGPIFNWLMEGGLERVDRGFFETGLQGLSALPLYRPLAVMRRSAEELVERVRNGVALDDGFDHGRDPEYQRREVGDDDGDDSDDDDVIEDPELLAVLERLQNPPPPGGAP